MNGNKIPYHFVCFLYNFIYLYHNTVPYYRFPNFLESIDLFSVTVALRVVSCNSKSLVYSILMCSSNMLSLPPNTTRGVTIHSGHAFDSCY